MVDRCVTTTFDEIVLGHNFIHYSPDATGGKHFTLYGPYDVCDLQTVAEHNYGMPPVIAFDDRLGVSGQLVPGGRCVSIDADRKLWTRHKTLVEPDLIEIVRALDMQVDHYMLADGTQLLARSR